MKEKWIVIIAAVALGGVGYLYWKDKNSNASGSGASKPESIIGPTTLADTSIGSYVDPSGGMAYVDAVPVSVTSSTGFTAADYNYGAVDESPLASAGGYDLVHQPGSQTAATIVPTGVASLLSYAGVVG